MATATAVAGQTPQDGEIAREAPRRRSPLERGDWRRRFDQQRRTAAEDELLGMRPILAAARLALDQDEIRRERLALQRRRARRDGDDEHAGARRAQIGRDSFEPGAAAGDDDGRAGGEARQAERHVGADEARERGIQAGARKAAEMAIVDFPQRAAGVARFGRQLARRDVAVVADRAVEVEGEGHGRGRLTPLRPGRGTPATRAAPTARAAAARRARAGAVGRHQAGAREVEADDAAAEVGAGVGGSVDASRMVRSAAAARLSSAARPKVGPVSRARPRPL